MAGVSRLTGELLEAVAESRAAIAKERGRSRDWLDKIGRGGARLSLPDAEWLAEKLEGRLEFVRRADPVGAFRRALDAQTDISDDTREAIWAVFVQAKTRGMRSQARGQPKREQRRAASS